MSKWTTDPPEQEGWYWILAWGEVREDPHYFQRRNSNGMRPDGDWHYWNPWEMRCVGGHLSYEERDWERWGFYGDSVQRSIHPATPPPPEKDDPRAD